jgi:hypothetical protein
MFGKIVYIWRDFKAKIIVPILKEGKWEKS